MLCIFMTGSAYASYTTCMATPLQTLEKMSASESAVASSSVDVKGNRDPVRHRALKTVCLYVSFGAMVRQLEMLQN